MKKYSKISFAAALCLVISLFAGCLTGFAATPEVIPVDSYADVGETHWAYPWVTFMTNEGYIHGYPTEENDGQELYKPDQLITRAEFVTILYFMLLPTADMTDSFTDLALEDWYYEYISKAVGTGYMSGYGDGTVKPNAYITREEATSIVYRAFKIDKYTDVTEFSDAAEIDTWAYEAIMSLAELGIIVGYTGEAEDAAMIQPKVNIKRAEVASLLANADKFYPTTVRFSETAVELDATAGGTVSFDLLPKNTSDALAVAISVEPETTYTVTYTKGGTSATVTPEELAQIPFTADELKNANIVINFPDTKAGDSVTVKVAVTDNEAEGEDKTIGSNDYAVTFTDEEPEPTPTPTPAPTQQGGGFSGGGGGTITTKYTVTFYDVDGTTVLGTVSVVSGGKLSTIPEAPAGKAYVWYTDATLTEQFDITQSIKSNMNLYAKADRDRVVEALKGYQATKGQDKATATANVLSADVVDATIEGAHDSDNNKWWTNDMLTVIVTNDKNHLADGEYDDVVTGKALKSTYEDVARYVVDNSDVFADATVTTATKFEYVSYFRAMVKTIDAAANDAIKAYKDALANGGTKDAAYEAFKAAAVVSLANSLEAESLDDEQFADLSAMALAYVAELVTNAGDLSAIKVELEGIGADNLTVDTLATMLDKYLVYAK